MRTFVNNFQTLTKVNGANAEDIFDIKIDGYNSVTIFNNTTSNLISWDNYYNYIQPNSFVKLEGKKDEYLYGILKIILFEQILGFPAPKCVLVKKRYIDANV